MKIKGLGFGAVIAIVGLVGCGSSSGTGGTGGSNGGGTGTGKGGTTGSGGKGGTTGSGSFTTSVPSGTKVTGLTSSQAAQLCSDVETYVNDIFFPAVCNASSSLTGLEAAYIDLLQNPSASNSELQAACASAAGDAGSCSDFLVDGGTATCNISSVPATCQATVGDYTKCINDQSAADLQFYASVPGCGTLTAASVKAYFAADGGSSVDPPQPVSCTKFDSTCNVDGGTTSPASMSLRMMPPRRR